MMLTELKRHSLRGSTMDEKVKKDILKEVNDNLKEEMTEKLESFEGLVSKLSKVVTNMGT